MSYNLTLSCFYPINVFTLSKVVHLVMNDIKTNDLLVLVS